MDNNGVCCFCDPHLLQQLALLMIWSIGSISDIVIDAENTTLHIYIPFSDDEVGGEELTFASVSSVVGACLHFLH